MKIDKALIHSYPFTIRPLSQADGGGLEPVFVQIKERRGFRRFSFRGMAKVSFEWRLICLSGNLLKLFRSG